MKHFFSLLLLGVTITLHAQKPVLDHTVYDSWKKVANEQISNRGRFVSYRITPQEGNSELYIKDLVKKRELLIPRGYSTQITPNEKFIIGKIQPTFKQKKELNKKRKKEKRDTPSDTLFIASLDRLTYQTIAPISSYKKGKLGNSFIAYMPKNKIYTQDSLLLHNPLIIHNLDNNKMDTVPNVEQYIFNESGDYLALSIAPNKKDTTEQAKKIIIYELEEANKRVISEGFYKYTTPTFNKKGNQLAFLASKDSILPTNKNYNLYLYKIGQKHPKLLIDTTYTAKIPHNWHFTSNSTLKFSENGERLFTSIAPLANPKDTITATEEQAKLDIWHYKDFMIQPYQLKNRTQYLNKTYPAVINLERPHQMLSLSTNFLETFTPTDQGDGLYSIIVDRSPYMIERQWSMSAGMDIYAINLNTGEKTRLRENHIGSVRISPKGKFLLLYNKEDRNWYSYNLTTHKTVNLTGKLDVSFWDEESDTPNEPYPYGIAGWTENDDEVLIYDAYDIWKFNLGNRTKQTCITAQNGRKNSFVYRIIETDPDKRFFTSKEKILLKLFNKESKNESIATTAINKEESPKELLKQTPYQFKVRSKAKEKASYLFTKSNFNTIPDLWVTENKWKKAKKLSHLNTQIEKYNWGTVEKIKWTAFDKKEMEGLLYKPEDFDSNKKYPMMIYFYEKHSDNLNQYFSPSPSWSIINIPFYVSRGYLVFCPDIHYTTGLPGESAYNSVVSGAEMLTKNSWVDKNNVAIQGQSWGGYQVAYLVTRTNMFKAAGSGAPVSNMTSAYGGIRWGTGTSRQVQYEMGQSRIGRTLWEAPELYISNSPLFRADKIETPLLIMHNDNDGAVPWYQGIELFMALRRLQKPAWLLQYNNEEHNLKKRVNRNDLSIRLQQFFDHYLKGEPAPEWLIKGVPATRKGKTMGYELIK